MHQISRDFDMLKTCTIKIEAVRGNRWLLDKQLEKVTQTDHWISFNVEFVENSRNHYFNLYENPKQTIREENTMGRIIAGNTHPKIQNSKFIWECQENPTTNM